MMDKTIAFIGGGNMAHSLIGGLIGGGHDNRGIWVSDPNAERLGSLSTRYGVRTTHANGEAAARADVIVLAVKPQVMHEVAAGLKAHVDAARHLVISIAAGIRIHALETWFGAALPIVRAMPNTPALVQSAATALVANKNVSRTQRDAAETVMRSVGLTFWLDDESGMDAVTALSGCGPAYFFLLMECLEKAAGKLGLSAPLTRLLTLQTAFGTAKLALESEEDTATLRSRVTSPGGATEQAIKVLIKGDIQALFDAALHAAYQRSRELADQLGEKHG